MGITFTVYSEAGNIDRSWPFDVIPRVIDADEWARISKPASSSACPRSTCFIDDLYDDAEGRSPTASSRPSCWRTRPTSGPSASACARPTASGPTSAAATSSADADGTLYVLEDNLRVPSGVSYMLENRHISQAGVRRRCSNARHPAGRRLPDAALAMLAASLAPDGRPTRRSSCSRRACSTRPTSSTRSSPNGWASQLVEGARPRRRRGRLRLRAHDRRAAVRVDVIYRRVDDLFLDPEVVPPRLGARRPRPHAGLAGRQRRHRQRTRRRRGRRQGRLRLRARPDPLLPGRGTAPPQRADLPLPRTRTSGSYVLDQPRRDGGEAGQRERRATGCSSAPPPPPAELADRGRRRSRPIPATGSRQPILDLSTAPTLCDGGIEPRHVDLRPFILTGEQPAT